MLRGVAVLHEVEAFHLFHQVTMLHGLVVLLEAAALAHSWVSILQGAGVLRGVPDLAMLNGANLARRGAASKLIDAEEAESVFSRNSFLVAEGQGHQKEVKLFLWIMGFDFRAYQVLLYNS